MKIFIVILVSASIGSFAGNYFRWGYDSTDDARLGKLFGKRSGLCLYTDSLTGAQYVKGGLFGGLALRVDKEGKPVSAK